MHLFSTIYLTIGKEFSEIFLTICSINLLELFSIVTFVEQSRGIVIG